jgi:predicted esterase YcpF (UPF0227 family)
MYLKKEKVEEKKMKILNIHGFASAGENGVYKVLKKNLENDEVITFDVPVNCSEAIYIINYIVDNYGIDLVVGNSLGGLYALCLNNKSVRRILVNPCVDPSSVFGKTVALGRHKFSSPRQNPKEKDFSIDDYFVESVSRFAKDALSNIHPMTLKNTYIIVGTKDEICTTTKDIVLEKFGEDHVTLIEGAKHVLTEEQKEETIIPLVNKLR